MTETLPLRIGQYALLARNDGKILVLQRKNSKLWSLPGGRLESGETDWLDALKREIKEETGIEISSADPYRVNIVEDAWQTKYCVYFKARLELVPDVKMTEEHIDLLWLDKDNCETVRFEYPFVQEMVREYLKEYR